MAAHCHNPTVEKHEIPDGARKITIPALTVEWGDRDLRDSWTGAYVFCSFGCLEEWAGDKAADHDGHVLVDGGHVLVDGEPPRGDGS